jgi:hypothetical protein
VPVVLKLVASVASPELSVPVPSAVVPSSNVTVPVAADGETVAVSVTLAPSATDVADAVRVVVVAVVVSVVVVVVVVVDVVVLFPLLPQPAAEARAVMLNRRSAARRSSLGHHSG